MRADRNEIKFQKGIKIKVHSQSEIENWNQSYSAYQGSLLLVYETTKGGRLVMEQVGIHLKLGIIIFGGH